MSSSRLSLVDGGFVDDEQVAGDAVVIVQVDVTFSARPGCLRPFSSDYRIVVVGEQWPRQNGSRSEARRIARREARRLGLPVVEVSFR